MAVADRKRQRIYGLAGKTYALHRLEIEEGPMSKKLTGGGS
jgi:hypothetical protein